MTNDIFTKTNSLSIFDQTNWEQMERVAQTFIQSKAMPAYITNAAQLMLIFSHGAEMGMSPTEAISSLYIVNGAVNIWGKAAVARLTREGYRLDYQEGDSDNEKAWCQVAVTRGEEKYTQTYTFAMARGSIRMTDKYNHWKPGWAPGQNRLLKLRYGAINIILKTHLPHLLYGCNGLAEIDGEVISGGSVQEGKVIEPEENSKQLPELTPEELPQLWAAAVEKLANNLTTLEIIQSHYTISPANLKVLEADVSEFRKQINSNNAISKEVNNVE